MFYLKKTLDTAEIYFLSLSVQHICMHHIFADFYLYPTPPHFSQDKCTSSVTQQFSYSGRKKLKVNIAFLNNIHFLLWNIKSGLQNSTLFYALLLYQAESTWSPLNLEAKQTRAWK